MHYRYDNVITLRTFSKAYGLAGIRIGYGFAHDRLIGNLLKVKLPFEPSTLAQAAGVGALNDEDFLRTTLAINAQGKEFLERELQPLGLKVLPTQANFVCIPFGCEETALSVYQGLLRRGVIVRPLRPFGLPHCLRITIGTPEQNLLLLEALKQVLAENPVVASED
jgi:histidinol-phosphate aminotransferase